MLQAFAKHSHRLSNQTAGAVAAQDGSNGVANVLASLRAGLEDRLGRRAARIAQGSGDVVPMAGG